MLALAASPDGGGTPLTGMIIMWTAIIAIFYFLLIRPQQKRAREHKTMVQNLKRGDQVVTGGGILGKVTRVKEGEEIEVEIADNTRVRVYRSTVTAVLAKTEPAKES
jgi:preprotein translocase subunit YajC